MYLLIKVSIFHCYVSLPEGNNAIILVNFSSTEPTSFAKKMSSTESSDGAATARPRKLGQRKRKEYYFGSFRMAWGAVFSCFDRIGCSDFEAVDIFVGVLCEW